MPLGVRCPVCKASLPLHCRRPDCKVYVCASCPLAWDEELKWASSDPKVEHVTYQAPAPKRRWR